MTIGRPKTHPVLSDEERAELLRLTRRAKTSRVLASRARVILECAEGFSDTEVAAKLRVDRETVGRWRRRFLKGRIDALVDEPRSGAPRKISDAKVEEVLVATLESTPVAATHWSRTSMAKRAGISESTVGRIWRSYGLQPHRAETFRLSNDPFFIDKVRDVVGLYVSPPERAVVLSVDEKSQIQALNRAQPLLPMRPGQAERRTCQYERHGTTSLFAALDVATGKLIGKCYRQHRAKEFVSFLRQIDEQVAPGLDVHLILDNLSTHKAPAVKRWLLRHPRFTTHFTPTYSSWLNQVERVFADLTQRQIKRGSHRSVAALEKAINDYIAERNRDPRPFKWTKNAEEILASVARAAERTLAIHHPHGLSGGTSGGGH